jgi:2-iminobutanoate/2-iminopropanoate deaminase
MTGPDVSPALTRVAVVTDQAPAPAGTYSQAIIAGGLVHLAGQLPKLPDGTRIEDAPFADQARAVLTNLEAVAVAAGSSLRHAVKVTVFLNDPLQAGAFDAIFATFIGEPPPARTTVQSSLARGAAVEVDAIVLADPPLVAG